MVKGLAVLEDCNLCKAVKDKESAVLMGNITGGDMKRLTLLSKGL